MRNIGSSVLETSEHCLNGTTYVSVVTYHDHPFIATVFHLVMSTSSRIIRHVTKLKPSPIGFFNMTLPRLVESMPRRIKAVVKAT